MERSRNPKPKQPTPLPADVATAAEMRGMMPLDYMLMVMRNPKTSQRRRDRMCVVAARYIHSRPGGVSKKQLLAEAAERASCEWNEDMALFLKDKRQQ